MEGEEWVPSNLDESGATASGGVTGTSGGSGPYSNPEKKRRYEIFLKKWETHGGFNLGVERNDMMAAGCGSPSPPSRGSALPGTLPLALPGVR